MAPRGQVLLLCVSVDQPGRTLIWVGTGAALLPATRTDRANQRCASQRHQAVQLRLRVEFSSCAARSNSPSLYMPYLSMRQAYSACNLPVQALLMHSSKAWAAVIIRRAAYNGFCPKQLQLLSSVTPIADLSSSRACRPVSNGLASHTLRSGADSHNCWG